MFAAAVKISRSNDRDGDLAREGNGRGILHDRLRFADAAVRVTRTLNAIIRRGNKSLALLSMINSKCGGYFPFLVCSFSIRACLVVFSSLRESDALTLLESFILNDTR